MGGMRREGRGWEEGRLVPDRRQDRCRNDHGPAPGSRINFDREQIRGEGGNAEISNVMIQGDDIGVRMN